MNISAPAIPIVGQAELVASAAMATIKCPCSNIIMGQMGTPILCSKCKRVWFVSASMKVQLQEVLGDAVKQLQSTQ